MESLQQSAHASFRVRPDDVDRRVDRVVRRLLPRVPLARLYQALREGDIRVNGARVPPATRTRVADLIWVRGTLAASNPAPQPSPLPDEPGDLPTPPPILYRDGAVMVVAKPAGLPVHGRGDSVLARLRRELTPRHAALSFSPAPVHQLDRITSGTLVIAETLGAARQWSEALRTGNTLKLYLAVVAGHVHLPDGGALWTDTLSYDPRRRLTDTDRAGATAGARVWTLAGTGAGTPATLLLVQLLTGRRHQIRAQAALRGHPLVGDRRYGARRGTGAAPPPLLHAAAIRNDLLAPPVPVLAPLPTGARQAIDQRFGSGTARRADSTVAARVRARPQPSPSAPSRAPVALTLPPAACAPRQRRGDN